MIHSFNPVVAEKIGIEEAVIFECIGFWCSTNKANGNNFIDGKYWTFNSATAYHKIFFYMSPKKIQRALLTLESAGLIVSGEYNGSSYNRTKWYALSDYGEDLYSGEQEESDKNNVHSIGQNCPLDGTEMSSRLDKNVQSMTINNKTVSYTVNNNKAFDKSNVMPHSESVAQQVKKVLSEWNDMAYATGMAQVKRVPPESERYRMLKARLSEYGIEDVLDAIANVRAGGSYLSAQRWFDFGWFLKPNNFPKVLEGKYGKGKREKPKEDHPKPETKEIVKDDEYYNAMSAEEWIKYFEETYGNDDDKT